MFVAEFEPVQRDSRRRSPRAAVSFDAGIGPGESGLGENGQGGIGRTLCRVTDISVHGARLQSYSALRRGTSIWLTLPHIGPVAAEVMWADDFIAGCQFKKPLTKTAFERLTDIAAILPPASTAVG